MCYPIYSLLRDYFGLPFRRIELIMLQKTQQQTRKAWCQEVADYIGSVHREQRENRKFSMALKPQRDHGPQVENHCLQEVLPPEATITFLNNAASEETHKSISCISTSNHSIVTDTIYNCSSRSPLVFHGLHGSCIRVVRSDICRQST